MTNKLLFVTTKKINSIALVSCKENLIEYLDGKITSKEILIKIDKLLRKSNLKISNIKEILVDLGPGSYTGIKIGLSVIKAINFEKNIKIFTSNSFEIMLSKYKTAKYVLIDAKLDEFYCYDVYKKEIMIYQSLKNML